MRLTPIFLLTVLLLMISQPSYGQKIKLCVLTQNSSQSMGGTMETPILADPRACVGQGDYNNPRFRLSDNTLLTYNGMKELIDGLRADYRRQAEENRKFRADMRVQYVSDMQRMNELVGDLTESLQQAIHDVAGPPQSSAPTDSSPRSNIERRSTEEGAEESNAEGEASTEASEKTAGSNRPEGFISTSEIRAQVASLRLELVHLQSMLQATQELGAKP